MKLIKLKLVNPTNPEGDTVVAVRPDEIKAIMAATTVDKRHRPEMGCIIYTSQGPWAVRETLEFVQEKVEEKDLDI